MRTGWDEELAAHKADFEEGLARVGFRLDNSLWRGAVKRRRGFVDIVIFVPELFPLARPKVYPSEHAGLPWSWHREKDGALCLIAEEDYSNLWWSDVGAFLSHISSWFDQADDGWPKDKPDLDLDRYFESSKDTSLVLFGDLAKHKNSYVRWVRGAHNTLELKSSGRRPPGRSARKFVYGYVGDLGELRVPPRSWEGIASLLDDSLQLESDIRRHQVELLLLTYRRGGRHGVLAVDSFPNVSGGVTILSRQSASTAVDARTLRAGPNRLLLSQKSVAIVGVGAVGSHVADLMLRAGIARMTLVDFDVLKPGNVIRHLSGPSLVGLPKVEAVARTLRITDGVRETEIVTESSWVSRGHDAFRLLEQHDLVIDTAADFSCTALLQAAARVTGRQIVSGCIQNQGRTARVDVLPHRDDQQPVPDSRLVGFEGESIPEIFEAGCATAISPAAPSVVNLAAALTAHFAVEVLACRPLQKAGQVMQFGGELAS